MNSLITATMIALALLSPSAWGSSHSQRVIITFKSGTPAAARDKTLAKLGGSEVASILSNGHSNEEFVALVADVPSKAELDLRRTASVQWSLGHWPAGIKDLTAADSVLNVEVDYRTKWIESSPAAFANMPALNGSLDNFGIAKFTKAGFVQGFGRSEITWGVNRVKAPAAWDFTEGAGVRVAVIDTGIYWRHPDLLGRVVGGYNAITDSEDEKSYLDDNEPGHGTHVAGTIAAIRDGKGVVGVAPKAWLYAVKVLDAEGSGNLSDVIKGIIWAANNNMEVANISLGSPMPSEAMGQAVRYAKSRGVVIVAAAGNSCGKGTCEDGKSSVIYPAAYPQTIAVAASDGDNRIAEFSSRGSEVKFIAPGVDILSTMNGGDHIPMSGTSMAAPHVAGLAALTVARGYRGLDGDDGVLAQLIKAAKPLPGVAAAFQGYGMINAGKLVR